MPKILVVDDDEQIRELVDSMLTAYGYEITLANNGQLATRVYREQPFDLVITDLVMPDMEGIELIQKLRAINQNVTIIAMSGGASGASETYLKTAGFLGARYTLPKPFKLDELLKVVSTALEQP